MKQTLVLGSGISALAYLFYNPDAFALTGENVGGHFSNSASLGPIFLWKTKSTEKFISDLNIDTPMVKTIKVGYWYKQRLWSQSALESAGYLPEVKELYSLKTRGTEPRSSYLSSGKGEFEIYNIPVHKLVNVLLERVELRLIPCNAEKIAFYDRIVNTKYGSYNYDKLISTIPAPTFLKLWGASQDQINTLIAYDKLYQKVSFEQLPAHPFEKEAFEQNMSYVYVVDSPPLWHRSKIIEYGGVLINVVREYTATPQFLERGKLPEGTLQKQGQIISGGEILASLPPSVQLLGRYAQWEHGIRTEDVLEEIQS